MSPLPDGLRSAVTALAARPKVVIATDFDGVLAPLVHDPMASRALPGTIESLEGLAALPATYAAVVSGRDLATLTQRLLRIPAFARIADARSAVLRSARPQRHIETINELLRMAPWVTGVKTGHTFGALYVLVGSGRRRGTELISVAIGAPTDEDRFNDNIELLDYGFAQYKPRRPIRRGAALADPSIEYAGGELPLRAARGITVGVRPDQRLAVAVRAPREVEGPIRRGAALGTATVFVDGLRAGRVPLRAGRAVPKAFLADRVRSFLDDEPIPVAIAVFAILMGVFLLWRLLRRGDEGEDEMAGREEMRAKRERQRDGGPVK